MNRILDIFTKDALDAARANNTYRSMRLMETPESSCVKIRHSFLGKFSSFSMEKQHRKLFIK
jgi:hypothetical protein